MQFTFETRIPVTPELDALLGANAAHWSLGLRHAWVLLYRKKLTPAQAYAPLCKLGFTTKQGDSLLASAQMRHAALVELKKYELGQLELAVEQRERALKVKRKKIKSLDKRLSKLCVQRDKHAPKPGKSRNKSYLKALSAIREVQTELNFCHNWVRQKERVLQSKQGQLAQRKDDIVHERYALCFGSKALLRQRPTEHNQDTTPFKSLEDWRKTWDTARNGQWWAIGTAAKPSGNAEVQWLLDTNQLRLRLSDKLAHERMDAQQVPHHGGPQKECPRRMACRFVVIDGVDFSSHKGFARQALTAAMGLSPVTMRVISRLLDDGSRAWYLQASIEAPSGFTPETARSREAGVMGLDFNARGVAWCVVKPDGNQLVLNGVPQHGFMPWSLKGLTQAQRQQDIGTVVAILVRHAKRLGVPLAIENLDFATKKLAMRAGAVNKPYNDMLGSLPSAQFAELAQRSCEREHLKLYLVNPSYSSVGGFTKYGRPNRLNADTSAALWLGRQALYGDIWKTDGAQYFVKKEPERLVFSHLRATPMQRMTALSGVQWKDVARGLGVNRKQWGFKFHAWFLRQVETASRAQASPLSARAGEG